MTLISVITINYNNAKGLKKTTPSVINQVFDDFEYIVIDGGSSDGSVEIIKQSSKITKWVSENDKGIYDAMNKGISIASGNYILFINSGDELANNNVLLNVSKHLGDNDIVYGNMIIVDGNGISQQGLMPKELTLRHMMVDTLWHPVSFIKKELFNKIGLYNTNYKIVADYHWFFKALFMFHVTYKHISENISIFYLGGMSSESNNSEKLKQERIDVQIEVLGKNEVDRFYDKKNRKERSLWYRILKKIRK